jgi:hypothetical protein
VERRSDRLRVGECYTRAQLQDLLEVPEPMRKGNWFTGYHCHLGEWFVFAGIGTPGRTGHDYANHWESNGVLCWRGKTNSGLSQPAIRSLLSGPTHVFTRESDREPFEYQGIGEAFNVEDTVPVTVRWKFPNRKH